MTYQTNEYTEELSYVSVGHGVETTNQSIEQGDTGRDDDGGPGLYLQNHRDCRTLMGNNIE